MSKSGKNYRNQLGMSKSQAEQIILATLVGEWVRDQYHPRELSEAINSAQIAIHWAWNSNPATGFLQWQSAARELFKAQIIKDSFDPTKPENIVLAATVSELILCGDIEPTSLKWSNDRVLQEIRQAVNDAAAPTIPEWIKEAVALYRHAEVIREIPPWERTHKSRVSEPVAETHDEDRAALLARLFPAA
jgi:hypothetical protein